MNPVWGGRTVTLGQCILDTYWGAVHCARLENMEEVGASILNDVDGAWMRLSALAFAQAVRENEGNFDITLDKCCELAAVQVARVAATFTCLRDRMPDGTESIL